MKKVVKIVLISIVFIATFSCGPKRYGCNPNRRCEVKEHPKTLLLQQKTASTLS
jgi:hypothetical protein